MPVPSVGKDVEEPGGTLHTLLVGTKNGTTILETSLSASYKGKHTLNI